MIKVKNPGWFYTLMVLAAVNFFFVVVGMLFLINGQEYGAHSILMSAAMTVFPAVVAFSIHTEKIDKDDVLRKVNIDE